MSPLIEIVPIAAPAPTVWSLLTDWAGQGRWMIGTRVWPEGEQQRSTGDRLAAWTGLVTPLGRLGFLDTMVVTEWREGHLVTVAHTGRIVRGTGTFIVAATGPESCEVTWVEDLGIPGGAAGAALWRLTRPLARIGVRMSLRRLGRIATAGDRHDQWVSNASTAASGAVSGIQ